MNRTAWSLGLARAAFVTALAAASWFLLAPGGDGPSLIPWDKAQHFIGFYGLALLAAAAFPRQSLLLIGAGLSLYGGLMELAQGLPTVGRDPDLLDWIADTLGLAAVLLPVRLPALRARLARRSDAARRAGED